VTIGATLALAVLVAAPVDAARTPAIVLVKTHPVQVRGSGFHSGESVRLTVRAEGVAHATATVGGDGGFVARVGGATVSHCRSLVIRAAGSDGSRATLRRAPLCPVHGG
jgi:hypothetical protein